MYDVISNIISHEWLNSGGEQQFVYYICGFLIIMLVVVFVDLIYRIFRHFWR